MHISITKTEEIHLNIFILNNDLNITFKYYNFVNNKLFITRFVYRPTIIILIWDHDAYLFLLSQLNIHFPSDSFIIVLTFPLFPTTFDCFFVLWNRNVICPTAFETNFWCILMNLRIFPIRCRLFLLEISIEYDLLTDNHSSLDFFLSFF